MMLSLRPLFLLFKTVLNPESLLTFIVSFHLDPSFLSLSITILKNTSPSKFSLEFDRINTPF